MKEYAKNPKHKNDTPENKSTVSRQASASVVLQKYKENMRPEEKTNQTGLPDDLKEKAENLSGYNLDDVKVYYNSDKPAQLQALAYTQGTNIHIAPGQEKHLPHEAWHVVQQKQGRVRPTMHLDGVPVNDNAVLEKEADHMRHEKIKNFETQNSLNVIQLKRRVNSSSDPGLPFFNSFQPQDGRINGIPVHLENLEDTTVKCNMYPGGSVDFNQAMDSMALLQRYFYNQYILNPFTDDELVTVINYSVSINRYGDTFIYEQDLSYSNSAAGYVQREKNHEKISHLESLQVETGLVPAPNSNRYRASHTNTGERVWREIALSNFSNGLTTGDNGSKLTAERARFEPLFKYEGDLSDNTVFEIGGLRITAFSMTKNTNAIHKVRQYSRLYWDAIEKLRNMNGIKDEKPVLMNILYSRKTINQKIKDFNVQVKEYENSAMSKENLFSLKSFLVIKIRDLQ